MITSGRIARAHKVVIYGAEGVGKTLFASKFPDPVFIDTEGSTKHYDVKRLPEPYTWDIVASNIKYVIDNPTCCKTLVIDTMDWAEKLCIQHVLLKAQKNSIEDFGYGKGYTYVYEEVEKFLKALDEVIRKGINVVLCAHAQMRKFEQPHESGSYDRWEMKLSKQVSPIVKEWADMVLFANFETLIVRDNNGKARAQGNKRIMFTTHHSCWDAKNRVGLNDKLDFDFKEIEHIFANTATEKPTAAENTTDEADDVPFTFEEEHKETEAGYMDKLRELMEKNKVTDFEITKVVSGKGYFPEDVKIEDYPKEFIEGVLIGAWEQVFKQVEALRNTAF